MSSPLIDIPGYEFVREIGAGGMATVYLCVQSSLQRKVAIKVMRRADADASFESRFLLEGRALARLPHRNIVGVFDIVQTPEINYISMEYLPGGTMVERLREGTSLVEAISVVVQIADALQLAHDNGIVHRDLKPANIMFRDARTPVLTDFGIAQDSDSQSTRLTQAGMMVGTPTYMSPEQASDGEIDGRSDQYSLGILFYEMLAGEPPFKGSSPLSVALAHVRTPPPPLPAQFSQFQPILDRLLQKLKDDRYPDLKAFVRDLKSLVASSDTLLARVSSDPDLSASAQLRAIGFYDSQSTGRTTPAVSSAARRSDPGMATVALSSAPQPGPAQPAQSRARKRWLPIGAFAAALLIALGAFWFVGQRKATLDPQMRAIVADTLSASDRLVTEGKLVAPPGNNAYEKLQTVLQVVPKLPEAIQRIDRIADSLRTSAAAALAAGRFDEAKTRIDEALAVRPDDLNALALQRQIATTRVDVETQQRVAKLVAQATAAEKSGNAFGEGDNAYTLLRRALEVQPANAQVQQQLAALTVTGLAPARESLAAGRLDEAETQLHAVGGFLAREPAWQAALNDVRTARAQAEKQQTVASLLATARTQVSGGHLADPAGDNALETLARVRELDAGNADARSIAVDVGARLAAQALQAESAHNFQLALSRYDQALQAAPDDRNYRQRKSALELQLGARQTQISRGLAGARAAITARQFLTPANDSAADRIDALLALDPGNVEAQRLHATLPKLIANAAQQMTAQNQLVPAFNLLSAASKRYPTNRDIAVRLATVAPKLQLAAAAAKRDQQLALVRAQLAKPRMDAAGAAQLGSALSELLAANPQDRDARSYRETFFRTLNASIDGATSTQALATLEPVITAARKALPNDAAATALTPRLLARRNTVAVQEQALIAASSGELLVSAAPWAEVVSIVDQQSQSVALPAARATPFRMSLRAGTYRVTLRHPGVGQPRVLLANIDARKSTRLSATFPTLTVERFLGRAGYAP